MVLGVRRVLLVIVIIQALVAGLFIFQLPLATMLWPFPGTSPLSTIFIGSIYAAAAASTGWCLLFRSDRGFVGIALDYVTILIPFALFAFARAAGGADVAVAVFGVASLVGVGVGLLLLRWSLARQWHDQLPVPRIVRRSFLVFVVALLIVGGALVLGVPGILPWTITPDLSVLFGVMFLGAAAYFAFGFFVPRWENAGGQLAGFLAYDLVLIIPFLQRLPTIEDRLRPNLVIYTAILILSGAIAAYYLAIHPRTRVWSAERQPIPPR